MSCLALPSISASRFSSSSALISVKICGSSAEKAISPPVRAAQSSENDRFWPADCICTESSSAVNCPWLIRTAPLAHSTSGTPAFAESAQNEKLSSAFFVSSEVVNSRTDSPFQDREVLSENAPSPASWLPADAKVRVWPLRPAVMVRALMSESLTPSSTV